MPTRKPSRRKLRRGEPWTLAEVRQLGNVPDSVLARRTGRTIKEVVAERERRRIKLQHRVDTPKRGLYWLKPRANSPKTGIDTGLTRMALS